MFWACELYAQLKLSKLGIFYRKYALCNVNFSKYKTLSSLSTNYSFAL